MGSGQAIGGRSGQTQLALLGSESSSTIFHASLESFGRRFPGCLLLIAPIAPIVPDNVVLGLNRKVHLTVYDVLGEGRGRDEFVLGAE